MSTKTRIWMIGAGLFCAVLILLGVVGGLMPQLSTASSTELDADNQELLNDIQRDQLARLRAAEETSEELSAELAELRRALPATAGSDTWVEELRSAEVASASRVTEFTVQAPLAEAAGAEEQAADQAAADETAADGAAGDGALAEGTTAPAEATPSSGVIPIAVTLVAKGPERANVAEFFRPLQVGDRLFLVASIDIAFDESAQLPEESWVGTVQGFLFTVPER